MGLTPFQEHPGVGQAIRATSEIAEKHLDLDQIWKIAKASPGIGIGGLGIGRIKPKTQSSTQKAGVRDLGLGIDPIRPKTQNPTPKVSIGIIRDSAFQFYYPENFEELERRGAKLIEISALKAKKLPQIDALYIGGGFPETHAIILAKNRAFRTSIQKAVEAGLPVYAECGGLMYLGEALLLGKKTYPMTGVFPLRFSLEKKPQAHGYTIITVDRANPFYNKGTILRGHEFHYSRVIDHKKATRPRFAFGMDRGEGILHRRDGICYKNVLATYTHLHALGSPAWADGMIGQAIEYRRGRT
jgi:cobyrinic acid a,c-diamide synthase